MFVFFFNDTATTEIYTLSLHDALPICQAIEATDHDDIVLAHLVQQAGELRPVAPGPGDLLLVDALAAGFLQHCTLQARSEEHTSELQSRQYLVCRLLLEKKKTHRIFYT